MMSETATPPTVPATIDDLYRVREKAELVGGRIIMMSPAGYQHGRCARAIFRSLDAYATRVGRGEAFPDNLGYQISALPGSGRQSFAPDVSYYDGAPPDDPVRFIQGPPTFAVEIRSPDDYGPAAEKRLANKRADYFAARTTVVWDVDLKSRRVFVHRATDPDRQNEYAAADAEPAVPGWRIEVEEVFR